MKTFKSALSALVVAGCAWHAASAAELGPGTLEAWNAYLKQTDLRLRERVEHQRPFLWMDESPERAARVRRGEVVVAPAVGSGTEEVPNGLVHDWIGVIFIPGGTLESVSAVIHDYDDYRRIYCPVVSESKTISSTDNSQEFQMVWQRKVLFVRAAMQGRYQSRDVLLDGQRGYTVAHAVSLREIVAYGRKDQRLLPPNTGSGFIWRIHSIARFEQRDGGVYMELEALALSRDVPASLAWLVNPFVNRLSISSLTTTLRQTRDAVSSPERTRVQTATLRANSR